MAREFVRIEFQGGGVVVVKVPRNGDGHIVQGNQVLGWDTFTDSRELSHLELIDELISKAGKKVERQINHLNLN